MVQLTRIYTRGGDKGKTSLGDGTRVKKDSIRIHAIGTVDEVNATIGLAQVHVPPAYEDMFIRIQHDLFDLGADLCVPQKNPSLTEKDLEEGDIEPVAKNSLRILESQVIRLEKEIDAMNLHLTPLNSFVLPGGSPAGAYLHLARTITRRAERWLTTLMDVEPFNLYALRYINRLSDHLFVSSRLMNKESNGDVLWQPGINR